MNKFKTTQVPQKNILTTKDGQKIHVSVYHPTSPSHCSLLLSSEIGWAQESYQTFCSFLSCNGIQIITFDYRGIAASKMTNYKTSLHQWATGDLDTVILFIKNQFPKHELVFLGHGWTGQLLGLAPASLFFDRLIFVDSQLTAFRFSVWKKLWKVFWKQGIPKGILKELFSWGIHRNGLFDFYSGRNYRKFQLPVLIYNHIKTKDKKFPAVHKLLSHFGNTEIEFNYFQNPFLIKKRSLPNEDLKIQEACWKEIVDWCK